MMNSRKSSHTSLNPVRNPSFVRIQESLTEEEKRGYIAMVMKEARHHQHQDSQHYPTHPTKLTEEVIGVEGLPGAEAGDPTIKTTENTFRRKPSNLNLP